MKNTFFFQLTVHKEQIELANQLVDYSILYHPIKDVFIDDPDGQKRQREYRMTGTLGEIIFADVYCLPRPTRSFGAIDGQDYGQDFLLQIGSLKWSFDVKTMHRKDNKLRENFVLNLPAYQLRKSASRTQFYFCISLHEMEDVTIASFIGSVPKEDVIQSRIGVLYEKGTRRIKDNGSSFIFQRDTFEVLFQDIFPPMISTRIRAMEGFLEKSLLPPLAPISFSASVD